MIDHLSLGIAQLDKSRRFYDASLGALGYRRLSDGGGALSYGAAEAMLWLLQTPRPITPDAQSGLHVSFRANSREAVDAFHRAALDNGGQDNGVPGVREEYSPGYYAAFVIDPDGYRLEAHCQITA